MKKYLMMALVGILLLGALAGCGKSETASGDGGKKVLTMGTSADFPPFESIDEKTGEVVGFDVELAKYITKELGYELKVKDMKFDGLVAALQAKRIDFAASGMSATEKRKKNVDFSTEYHHSGEIFITLKGSDITSIDDLEGKKVGVQLGSIQEEGAKKISKETKLEIKALDKVPDLIQELKTNRIDAVYVDKSVGEGFVKEMDLASFDDPSMSSPGMGIAFPKGSKLVKDFNKVLKEMQENGELEKLEKKWLEDQE